MKKLQIYYNYLLDNPNLLDWNGIKLIPKIVDGFRIDWVVDNESDVSYSMYVLTNYLSQLWFDFIAMTGFDTNYIKPNILDTKFGDLTYKHNFIHITDTDMSILNKKMHRIDYFKFRDEFQFNLTYKDNSIRGKFEYETLYLVCTFFVENPITNVDFIETEEDEDPEMLDPYSFTTLKKAMNNINEDDGFVDQLYDLFSNFNGFLYREFKSLVDTETMIDVVVFFLDDKGYEIKYW